MGLERAARTSIALDQLGSDHDLGSLAYYYMGTGNAENEDAINLIVLGRSLLTARGIPVAGKYEVKNVQCRPRREVCERKPCSYPNKCAGDSKYGFKGLVFF